VAEDVVLCGPCGTRFLEVYHRYLQALARITLLNPDYDGDDPQVRRFSLLEID
jgi:hypothetical protein